jgi:2-polyprenyl-6-methoxyphenol hydroxylase-like FAD-dependent oxidoreductase
VFELSRPVPPGAVVVCGAGAAGLAAALSAARHGAEVALLEASDVVGGTVAGALIHTLGGLYDSEGKLLNDGLPAELIERLSLADPRTRRRKLGRAWVLNVCPTVYREVVTRWLAEQPRLHLLHGAQVRRVLIEGRRICELEIVQRGGATRCRPRAVIDATGTAEVTRLIDAALVIDDGPRAAGGWIFRLSRVAPGALDFPKGLAIVRELRAAATSGTLPRECGQAWIDQGVADDEAFVKLMVPLGPRWREEEGEISRQARNVQSAVVEFLARRPDFATAAVTLTGGLGVRDGGRIRGVVTLTGDDVRQGRKFHDAAGSCAWPIEYWDPDRGVSVEYLPAGVHYEIPMRAMQVELLDNFWAAGKCLSADRWAHASARVVGACWAMGQSAGRAAASLTSHLEEQHDVQPLRSVSSDRQQAAPAAGHPWPAARSGAVVPRAE